MGGVQLNGTSPFSTTRSAIDTEEKVGPKLPSLKPKEQHHNPMERYFLYEVVSSSRVTVGEIIFEIEEMMGKGIVFIIMSNKKI